MKRKPRRLRSSSRPRRYPDIAKIGREIDWSPTTPLDDILGDVIAHQTEAIAV
ncbi:MAG: hypothetical protein ACR2LK_12300 [Solirubrobacteraceae bacterium]